MAMQLTCPVCGQTFEHLPKPVGGKPPLTCSEDCRRARKNRKSEESRRRAMNRECPDDKHGTATGYTFYKCSCTKCSRWARLDKQKRRAAQHN